MKRQITTIIILLISLINGYSQNKRESTFLFENDQIAYSSYFNSGNNIANFYVVFNNDDKKNNIINNKIEKCNGETNSRFYFLAIPKHIKKSEHQEKLFLAFVSHIVNSTKVIDSDLYIISDKNYTKLYEEVKKKNNHHYNQGYLNDIKDQYINTDTSNICDVIQK